MSINWECIIYLSLAISSSSGAVFYFLYKEYILRVETSKELSVLHDISIPPEVFELISRLNLLANIRIADDPSAIPNAAIFYQHPSYIIISRLFLDKSQFELKHLLALVAHESGHIMKVSKSTYGLILVFGAFFSLFVSLKFSWMCVLYSLSAFIFFLIIFIISSWVDEYNADAFAVKHALIPVEDLTSTLLSLEHRFERNIFKKITHPPIYLRINRIRRLYGV